MKRLIEEVEKKGFILWAVLWASFWTFANMTSVLMAATPSSSSPPSIVAEVDGEKITAEQLEQSVAGEMANLQEQIYNLKRQRLETIINDRLLFNEATKQKISVAELLEKEVGSKAPIVTDDEVNAFFEANKARIKDGPQVRQQIRQYLQNQAMAAQREKYMQDLRAKSKVVVNFPPPNRPRVEVNADGGPFKGPENAPVTIVKFEDFQCPFCRQAQVTLAQVQVRYPNKVRIVHRDFPVDGSHPLARKAAEAGRCANEQGKFWSYHDKLYTIGLTPDPGQLKQVAKELGLDMAAFEKCLDNHKYAAAVQKDVEQGMQLGITGTPAFYINGRMISGAQPLDAFVRIIDEEMKGSGDGR